MNDQADPEQDNKATPSLGLAAFHSDERVQFALAAARIGVFEWDPNSDALTWSSSTTGLGVSVEEGPTSGRAFFELVHPEDRSAIREVRTRALRDRTDAISEFRILLPSGVVHWVHAHGRVVDDADGKPLRVLGVNTDVTHRKSLEYQLQEAQVQVARLNVLKATMRTVQDIVNNALMSLCLFRNEAEPHVSPPSLQLFDDIINETVSKLRALGDLDHVAETDMVIGTGISYQSNSTKTR
jgi:PAS domain S-box-containing protein